MKYRNDSVFSIVLVINKIIIITTMRKFICNLLSMIVFSSCVPQCGHHDDIDLTESVPYNIEISFVDSEGNDLLKDAVFFDDSTRYTKRWQLKEDIYCRITPSLPLSNVDDGYRSINLYTDLRDCVWLRPGYSPTYYKGQEKIYTEVDYQIRFPYIFNDIDPHILHTFWTVDFGDAMNNAVLEKVVFNEKEVEFSKLNDYYDILLTIDTLSTE